MLRNTLLITLAAIGCSEQKFHTLNGADGVRGPAIELDPDFLQFGNLREGQEEIQTFTISSVGETALQVENIRVESDAPSFTILTDVEGLRLPVGEAVEVDVAFSAMAADEHFGQAIVTSNAAVETEVSVELAGAGTIAELQISPDPLDMGDTYVGCEKDNTIDLTNVGTDALEIYQILQDGASFTLNNGLDLPLTLEPDESVSVDMEFSPLDAGENEGTITVFSSEPLGEREAIQFGTGEISATYDEEWTVPANPPSDIVFYVDQSGSMSDDQARLASNFTTFISELNTYSTDWQIIVANDQWNTGCNNTSGVLMPGSPNYTTRFGDAVSSGGGWYTEAGLTVVSEAIDKTDAGECNYGFLRPDAMLHIIMVSDEVEQSPSTWNWYVDKIIAKKGSSANVKFSAIAGDYPGGCASASGGSADAGDGYYQPVVATDGVFLSICSDWATPSNLSMLAAASVQMEAYELGATAAPSTIQVFVNGTERNSGWHYDADDNTVVFDEGIPTEGDHVRVTYGGVASCD
ncbi:MAG: choice-of-anchor D domain-containing protein [Myxococcota bacterium]|nr:choice-of-anchor D domain-containing protein [Myxococcota bacterium]MEC9391561.1 choice-of-anchor D domain-containing protein [Myxococcota bacterium]